MIINKIKEEREKIGLTQEEFASKLQVSRQTIISLEKGSYNPSLELSLKIAKVLNKSIHELFVLEGED